MSNIKNKFISGVLWESIGRFSALGLQFIVTILIARVLSPVEFGIIGLLTVFIALGQILLNSGFSQALIQKKEATQIDFSSVYFMNMTVGIIIYGLLFFISPYIADFYNLPDLTNYARVLFLIIPINSFGLIQNVIIQKELAFKMTATASIGSAVLSGIVGIGMAYSGYGVWALVGQQVVIHSSRTMLFILQRRWMPIFSISFTSIREMFGFSMNLMFHSIVNVSMNNLYVLVFGKFFPLAQVGYYTQADKFQEVSAGTLSSIVIKVSYPALVHKKDDPSYLRSAYSKIFITTTFLVAPLMVFFMVVAEPLFRFLLTDKWLPAVPYFQILCVYGMVLPLLQVSYNLYKLFRKGRLLLWIDILRHFLVVSTMFLFIGFGIECVLLSLVVCTIVMTLLNLYASGRLISLSLIEQLKSVLPSYIVAFISGFLVSAIPSFESDLVTLLITGIIFYGLYIVVSGLLRLRGFKELSYLIKPLKRKLFN